MNIYSIKPITVLLQYNNHKKGDKTMNVPEAIGISMFEMDLYQKYMALLQ